MDLILVDKTSVLTQKGISCSCAQPIVNVQCFSLRTGNTRFSVKKNFDSHQFDYSILYPIEDLINVYSKKLALFYVYTSSTVVTTTHIQKNIPGPFFSPPSRGL